MLRPVFEVAESPAGLFIGARRNAENGNTTGASRSGDAVIHDDSAARQSSGARPFLDSDRRRELLGVELRLPSDAGADAAELQAMRDGKGIHTRTIPGTYIPVCQRGQRLPDGSRGAEGVAQPTSGVAGIAMQDASLQESMGPIMDRSREHLLSTDNGIIMARQRLMRAVQALQKGEPPPGTDPATHRVRSAAVVLPRDAAFIDAARDALTARAGVAPTSV